MATHHTNVSALSLELALSEDWLGLVPRDEEFYDPLFQGDTSFTGTADYSPAPGFHVPESLISDRYYPPSTNTSVVDGPSSFDYTVDGPSSVDHTSWLSTSPSLSTTASPPLVDRNDRARVSLTTYESLPLRSNTKFPLLETEKHGVPQSSNPPNSFQTASSHIFNPFIATSPHAFSSRDVHASQAFANVGVWAEQPQIIELFSEPGHTEAIAVPHPSALSNSSSFSSYLLSDETPQERNQARAINIPQPSRRAASYNPGLLSSNWAHQVPPVLSISPDARRQKRSTTVSRSISRSEPRRSRNSLTTPSPTSNSFGWVAYHPNYQTNRLVPSGTEDDRGRRQRGRTKALTAEQRSQAALMRVVGACSNCKKRKEKCDPGIPCKSCLDHYKGDLIHIPCRDRLLSDLSTDFLSDRLGWHPTARALESFVQPNNVDTLTSTSYTISLKLGFGPVLHVPVHALETSGSSDVYHNHVIYSWPPSEFGGDLHTHAVLPAVLIPHALAILPAMLDAHLSLLVTQHFRSFPLYTSSLRILREIYIFYRSLPTHTSHSHILHQALKLLVLIHIGGDLTLQEPYRDPILAQLVRTSMSIRNDITPTPCFIRAQLGSIMPALALSLMESVLSSLEQLFLNRECHDWPIALAVLLVVLMTVESIHYHSAKLPYHHKYDSALPPNPKTKEEEWKVDEQGIKTLFTFYSACFSGCHARLRPDWEGEQTCSESPEDVFIESVREAGKRAEAGGYLDKKAKGEREGDDMGFFFDRLVAKLLVLRP